VNSSWEGKASFPNTDMTQARGIIELDALPERSTYRFPAAL